MENAGGILIAIVIGLLWLMEFFGKTNKDPKDKSTNRNDSWSKIAHKIMEESKKSNESKPTKPTHVASKPVSPRPLISVHRSSPIESSSVTKAKKILRQEEKYRAKQEEVDKLNALVQRLKYENALKKKTQSQSDDRVATKPTEERIKQTTDDLDFDIGDTSDIAKAIVMNEILGPPVALRSNR